MKSRNLEKEIARMEMVGIRQWLLEVLTEAFVDARRGKLKTFDEHKFEQNWMRNLLMLREEIMARTYEPGASVAFVVFEPMVREIFAAPFRDRVIHHLLYNMQAGWWDNRFIYDSYSCRVGKGTLFGIKRVQRFMRMASEDFTKRAYVLKSDIQGYFMSLPRHGLYDEVKWGLDRQFEKFLDRPMGYELYMICVFLWQRVLFDDPVKKAKRRGPLEYWNPEILPPRKSLFRQPPGKGIVIGNLTSQLASNIYLNRLDRYVKYELGYQCYGRYVDDFIQIVPEEKYEQAKKDLKRIETYLAEELKLIMHPHKRYCQEINKGVSFLGARIYPHCLYPSDRLQSNFRSVVREVANGCKDIESLVSYLGLMRHLDSDGLVEQTFNELGWGYE